MAIDHWLVPTLGTVRLERLALEPALLQRWANKIGRRPRTVLARCVLRQALSWAMTQKQLTYNPAALVKVSRTPRKPVTPLSVEQGRTLIEAAAGHPLGAAVIVSLTMGLRIGEVSGLAWGALDVDARTLKVRQQLQAVYDTPPRPGCKHRQARLVLAPVKTDRGRRTLTMPALAESLKARRKVQLEERLRAGAAWDNAHDLVFTTPLGRPVHPEQIRTVLESLMVAVGIRPIRFHSLRHSAASLLLKDGTPLFDVSRVLGHAQISTTADIYGHFVPEMAAGAAAKMDTLFKKEG